MNYSINAGDSIFVGPLSSDKDNMFEALIELNKEKNNPVTHFPQILETGEVLETYENSCLINFGLYTYVLPYECVSEFDDEETYYDLIEELGLIQYDQGNELVYLNKSQSSDPEQFYKRVEAGVSFNDDYVLMFTKETIQDILVFYMDTSDIQSLEINGVNLSIGVVKILWSFIKYKEK